MGDLIYLPAINQSYLDYGGYATEMLEKVGFGPHCFYNDKRSPFYYPYFLISYYYGQNTPDLRKRYNLEGVFIKGDSGGFQNITQDADLDPQSVIEWQQENCDSGLILDQPPFKKIEGSAQFGAITNEIFEESLNKTIHNAKVAMKNWTKPDFQLFGVVQGDTPERQEKWLRAMLGVETECGRKFSGWSLSPKPSHSIKQIAYHAANMIENGLTDKPIHILQVSGFESLAMAAWVSRYFKGDVTVDSSTFNIGRIYFTYISSFDFLDKWDLGKRGDVRLKQMPCDCPVCQKIDWKDFSYDNWELKSPPGILISLHNLYQIIKYTKFLNSIKDDEMIFRKFCLKRFGQKFINMCDFVDEVALGKGKHTSFRKNVVRSQKLSSFFNQETGEEEINNDEIKNERIELLKKEFPRIADTSINRIYEQRYSE